MNRSKEISNTETDPTFGSKKEESIEAFARAQLSFTEAECLQRQTILIFNILQSNSINTIKLELCVASHLHKRVEVSGLLCAHTDSNVEREKNI